MRPLLITLFVGLGIQSVSAQFCIPDYTAGTTDNDYIDGVLFNTINNLDNGAGDGTGYSDFTDLNTTVFQGSTYELTLVNTPAYGEGYRGWIDYNQDGSFTDDEEIFTPILLAADAETVQSVIIPADAPEGTTIMRIRCVYSSIDFDACAVETYGEAEDYTINIIAVDADITITAIDPIADACELSANEPITVEINNVGISDATGFNVAFQVDGATPFIETFPGVLGVDEIASYTFTATADLSIDGEHEIIAWVEWEDDTYPFNDTTQLTVMNTETFITAGFPDNICYDGSTIFPTDAPPGGVWSGETIINATTGEMDPALVGGIGATTTVTYAYEPVSAYAVYEIPYYPKPLGFYDDIGLGDDDYESDISIGFDFTYFDHVYNKIFISSNGLIGFGAPNNTYAVQHLPKPTEPSNLIAFCWTDLDPSAGGDIYYELQGVAPNRKFIIEYKDVHHYLSAATVSGQIVLYETTNAIDIINIDLQSDGGDMTQGIENNTGTIGYVGSEDFNKAVFTIYNRSWRFIPTPCAVSVTDTISFISSPDVAIDDASACEGTSITLDAGSGAELYLWNTGASTQSITVYESGTYAVTYYANETCFVSDSALITIYPNPVIDLGDDGIYCEGTYLDAENFGSNYIWNTGATTQTIYVGSSGIYYVDVTIPASGCFASDTVNLEITPLPIADFDVVTDIGLSAQFTSLSTGANTWFWDFGDGTTSTEENPTHIYPIAGTYTVTLVITNDCGADIFTQTIQATTGVNAIASDDVISVYPNPASDVIFIKINKLINADNFSIKIIDVLGREILSDELNFNQLNSINIHNLPSGNYNIICNTHSSFYTTNFVKL